MLGSFISKGISIVSSIILARLLFEEDYGALVLSAIFAGLITQIGGMGYELFYLQHKGNEEERRKVLEQVYNLRLLTNFLMFIVQVIIGFYFFIFTENRTTGGILMMMAVSLMLEGFNAPQETLLKDKMEFKKITIGNIFKELFATIGKVAAAFLGFGGYSFGVGPVLGSLVRMFYLRSVQPYRHAYFLWDKDKIKEIFNFGKHILFGSVGMYLVQQVDRIFLTLFFPQNIVGRYGFAWGNASMINSYLVMPQGQLNLTYITKYKKGNGSLFEKLSILQTASLIFLLPIYTITFVFLDEIIRLVFTSRWIYSIPLIKIFLVYYMIKLFVGTYMNVLTGMGKPQINTRIIYFKFSLIVPTLFIIGFFDLGIYSYVISFVVLTIMSEFVKLYLSLKELNVYIKEYFLSIRIDIMLFILSFFFIIISMAEINSPKVIFLIIYLLAYITTLFFFRNSLIKTISFVKTFVKLK